MLEHIIENLLCGTFPTTEIQEEMISVFFYIDVFLVAVGILCHPGLDSCKVLTTTKKKINNGEKKLASHLLCP